MRANSEFSQCYQAANPTIICCGHSLGGAMATLCAAWIKTHHSSGAIVYCVTFGSPRVGNEIFRDNVHAALDVTRTFRVVMEGDPVPEVPSVGNWCHVGRKVSSEWPCFCFCITFSACLCWDSHAKIEKCQVPRLATLFGHNLTPNSLLSEQYDLSQR